MTPLIEGVSQIAVVAFYVAAAMMIIVALWHTRMWARRVSLVAMLIATIGWLMFYLFVSNLSWAEAPMPVLWSRIAGYNTAVAFFICAYVIRRADKYGINLALSREHHDG